MMRPRPGALAAVKVTDVARAAGVSPAVVSRTLNDDPSLRIRPETRERVIRVTRELGYTPNGPARALRLKTSGALCLVAHAIHDPPHAESVRGAQLSADRAGYYMLLGDAERFSENLQSFKALVSSQRVDGVILHLSGLVDDRPLRRIAEANIATVVLNSRVRGPAGSVSFDDAAAARVGVEHLLELGHRKIGFVSGVATSDRSIRRRRGAEALLRERALSLPAEWVVDGGWAEKTGHEAVSQLLRRRSRPTAIVVANVMAAIGALAAARDRGVDVPGELSIVAIHDIWFAAHSDPPLTTVSTPLREMGAAAVDLLIEMLNGGPRRSVVLRKPKPELVSRASTAPPRRV